MKFRSLFEQSAKKPWMVISIIRHLPSIVRLHVRLMADPRVPFYLKAIIVLAILYVIYPFDLVPDWVVPIVGNLDDVAVLIVASRYFLKKCPEEVLWEHVQAIETGR